METTPQLPESVLRDLQLYLSEGETVRKAISSASGVVGRMGELWMVLTDRTVYFHTREFGKGAVVALLMRRDIDSILYFQSKRGYTLTFTPRSAPQNITRVSFPREQRDSLEDFCEELADLIEFQAEGHPPIKPGEPLLAPSSDARPPSPPAPPITTVSTVPAIGSPRVGDPERATQGVQSPPGGPDVGPDVGPAEPAAPATVPDVRLARPMGTRETGRSAGAGASSAQSPDSAGAQPVSPPDVRLAFGEGPGWRYTAVATLVSLAVGFLWYRLFCALDDGR
ncbi:MAG TPA: hypothetical protein PLU72_11060 [Candidatus Ozemobacteraceae bacterium]|nr:hypothetical protein [Candidatus Ozemobacteraceae bacterium]HQG28621.1 hypothetical protein [Candidatus Ozemobacteraceae bacterium]